MVAEIDKSKTQKFALVSKMTYVVLVFAIIYFIGFISFQNYWDIKNDITWSVYYEEVSNRPEPLPIAFIEVQGVAPNQT